MKRGAAAGCLTAAWLFAGCASMQPLGLSHDPLSAQEHAKLGDAYLASKERNLALQQYEAALSKDKRNVYVLVSLGNLAYEDQQWKTAESYLRRAVKAAPDNAGAVNNLAMVYLQEGERLDKALRLVDHALPSAGALAPYLWDTRANIALRQGHFAEAKEALAKAQAGAPAGNPEFSEKLEETARKLSDALKFQN